MGTSRALLFAAIGGIVSAILSLGSLGPAPILAVGLAMGDALAGIAAAIAALLLLINLTSENTIYYIGIAGLPALLIVRLALIQRPNSLTWYPAGAILGWLVAYGLSLLTIATAYFYMSGNTLDAISRDFLQKIAAAISESGEFQFQSETDKVKFRNIFYQSANFMAPYFAGFILSITLLKMVAISTITQGILKGAGVAIRPSPSYVKLNLPKWLTVALALAIGASMLPDTIGSFGHNATLFLSIPFLLLGLTVIHTISRRTPNPRMILVTVYIALFLFSTGMGKSVPILAFIVLLGLLEQWLSLRRRIAPPDANQEDD